jgi:hypothetical protein
LTVHPKFAVFARVIKVDLGDGYRLEHVSLLEDLHIAHTFLELRLKECLL